MKLTALSDSDPNESVIEAASSLDANTPDDTAAATEALSSLRDQEIKELIIGPDLDREAAATVRDILTESPGAEPGFKIGEISVSEQLEDHAEIVEDLREAGYAAGTVGIIDLS